MENSSSSKHKTNSKFRGFMSGFKTKFTTNSHPKRNRTRKGLSKQTPVYEESFLVLPGLEEFNSTDEFEKIDATDLLEETQILDFEAWIAQLNKFYKKGLKLNPADRKSKTLLKTVIKESIPLALRCHAYLIFSSGFVDKNHFEKNPNGNFKFFKEKFLKKNDLGIISQIEKDLHRTYFEQHKELSLLKKRNDLSSEETSKLAYLVKNRDKNIKIVRNVLYAYAGFDQEVQYVQGMNTIVSSILYNVKKAEKEYQKLSPFLKNQLAFKCNFDETEVYYIFFGIMENLKWRYCFCHNLKKLQDCCTNFEELLKKSLPDVHEKMMANDVKIFNKIDSNDGVHFFFLFDNFLARNSFRNFRKNFRFVLFVGGSNY